MANLTQLRLAAREMFNEALRAVDAGAALHNSVQVQASRLIVCDTIIDLSSQRPVYAIALGKAAVAMAATLGEILGSRLTAGVISSSTPGYGTARSEHVGGRKDAGGNAGMSPLLRYTVFQGGHPEPNEQSLAGAQACFALLRRADAERALVIFLISGGGSAMIEWPITDEITLTDLRDANKALVTSGASIGEINAVRRAFSAVKGGRLAASAPDCDQITLIVSDVPTGEESNVASGPTLAPRRDAPRAREVIARYALRSQLPKAILRAIDDEPAAPAGPQTTSLRKHCVLLDNQTATKAAAKAARDRGMVTEIASDISDQTIDEGCSALLQRARGLRAGSNPSAGCLISGGEFACPAQGNGIGGRNLETALRLAILSVDSRLGPFVALCAGTDGIDGNSPAAGAIVDSTTFERARGIGLDPQDFLDRSDAYSFFVALGDVVATGPTGTNVRDIRILLTSTERSQ